MQVKPTRWIWILLLAVGFAGGVAALGQQEDDGDDDTPAAGGVAEAPPADRPAEGGRGAEDRPAGEEDDQAEPDQAATAAGEAQDDDGDAGADDDAPAGDGPAADASRDEGQVTEVKYIARITLTGRVHASPPGFSLFSTETMRMTLRDWLYRLAQARQDDAIEAVALEVDFPQLTWAQAVELADAVKRLNEVKPVHTFLTAGSAGHYLVAASGAELAMEPTGHLNVVGIGAEMLFFREALDWLGVEPQFVQVGEYKGAEEPFTRTEPSEALKGEYERLLDGLYEQLCSSIARARELNVAQVKAAIDQGPFDGSDALKHKLVDRLVTRLDWRDHLKKRLEGEGEVLAWREDYAAKEVEGVDLSNPLNFLSMLSRGSREPETVDPTIAIVYAEGPIVMGRNQPSLFSDSPSVGHETLVETFEKVRSDDNVKAVIFRIDSPGGSALASELIYQAVARCDEEKPVVVSVASMAASGGYYIASGGRYILADPGSILGSIGVVSGKLATSGLLDKLKIDTFTMKRGAHAGMGFSRPWNEEELAVVRKRARRIYETFVDRVEAGRGKRVRDIDRVARGRVFTSERAVENGLIDQIGGLRDAVIVAQEAAGVQTRNVIELPRPKTLADFLSGNMNVRAAAKPSLEAAAGRRLLGEHPGLAYMIRLAKMLRREPTLLALPHALHLRR